MSAAFEGRRLHLIGIGGAGMSGLAIAANSLGAIVSGSDKEASSYTERLESLGIAVTIGQDAANLPEDAEVVRSTAITDANPELAAARERGMTILHRSDLLAELAATRPTTIAVAGTHGKTTTTAMIAHILDELGEDPSYFVGGEVTIGPRTTNAHIGAGEIVVIEADESDGSFLRYAPDVAVITNVEFEHPETWSGLDELLVAFAKFAEPSRAIILPLAQPRRDEIDPAGRAISFGIAPEDADFAAAAIETPSESDRGTSFRLGEMVVALSVRGEHNVKNALAAIAALEAAGISRERSISAIKSFSGVARRFELIGTHRSGAVVYDDYAHHPTEVRAALTTARQSAGGGRVVVAYLPHLYSRTQAYAREFGEALDLADVIVVLDVYPARENAEDFPGVTGWMQAVRAADAAPGKPVYYEPTQDDAEAALERILKDGDLCIGIGAGDIFKLTRRLTGVAT
ncbi:MAG: UDP-N-acetylmuramate--L-alanine ligase [Solirubrobacterales bacterium]